MVGGQLSFESWEDFVRLSTDDEIAFERVPFSYPLVICYTSGTTGEYHVHVSAPHGDTVFINSVVA